MPQKNGDQNVLDTAAGNVGIWDRKITFKALMSYVRDIIGGRGAEVMNMAEPADDLDGLEAELKVPADSLVPTTIVSAINAENERAIAAERGATSTLESALENLNVTPKGNLAEAIVSEHLRAKKVEGNLTTLPSVLEEATATDTTLVSAIIAEKARAEAVEGVLTELPTGTGIDGSSITKWIKTFVDNVIGTFPTPLVNIFGRLTTLDEGVYQNQHNLTILTAVAAAADGTTIERSADGAYVNQKFSVKPGGIDTPQLANGAVTEAKISGSPTDNDARAVTTHKIADGAVTFEKIEDVNYSNQPPDNENFTETYESSFGSFILDVINKFRGLFGKVYTEILPNFAAADGVTIERSDSASYDGTQTYSVKDGGIDTPQLATGAVTEDKIADGEVTEDKIADLNVTEHKIADRNVTEDKIADGAVTMDKIEDLNVTESKIADGAVTAVKLDVSALTPDTRYALFVDATGAPSWEAIP
jgi:hypothetical protein